MTATSPPPKKRRRFRLLFVFLLLICLWQLVQRLRSQGTEPSRGETPASSSAHPAEGEAPIPKASPPAESESSTPEAAQPASHETPATEETVPEAPRSSAKPAAKPIAKPTPQTEPDFRYAVKWVDASDGQDVPHEKRDLTLRQAQREAGWLAKHHRRFYPGEQGARSPFSRLQVWVQCVCGRDVVDVREPHTVPGEDQACPHSGAGQIRPQDVILASR